MVMCSHLLVIKQSPTSAAWFSMTANGKYKSEVLRCPKLNWCEGGNQRGGEGRKRKVGSNWIIVRDHSSGGPIG